MKRLACVSVLSAVLFLCFASWAWAAEGEEHRAVKSLRSKGFTTCAVMAALLTEYLHEQDDYTYYSLWNQESPDNHEAFVLSLRRFLGGTAVTTLTVNPNKAGTCDGSFGQTYIFTRPCAEVKEGAFKKWRYFDKFDDITVYKDPEMDSISVLLIPLQSNCIVVKSGILFMEKKGDG